MFRTANSDIYATFSNNQYAIDLSAPNTLLVGSLIVMQKQCSDAFNDRMYTIAEISQDLPTASCAVHTKTGVLTVTRQVSVPAPVVTVDCSIEIFAPRS